MQLDMRRSDVGGNKRSALRRLLCFKINFFNTCDRMLLFLLTCPFLSHPSHFAFLHVVNVDQTVLADPERK
jgi:hypothetical protein